MRVKNFDKKNFFASPGVEKGGRSLGEEKVEDSDEGAEYEKRFQVNENQILQERLKGIQSIVNEMQREYPEVLSFTAYGSMVKGTATLESDIDGTLFINTTLSEDEQHDQNILEKVQSEEYLSHFKDNLQRQLDLAPEQVEDIRSFGISEHDVMNAATEYLAAQEHYEKALEAWESTKRDTGKTEKNLFGTEVPIYEHDGEKPKIPVLSENIGFMFNMDIGGGIRNYRKKFLETLATLTSEQADDICRGIAAYLSFSEGGKRKKMVELPHTYEDFKRIYL